MYDTLLPNVILETSNVNQIVTIVSVYNTPRDYSV